MINVIIRGQATMRTNRPRQSLLILRYGPTFIDTIECTDERIVEQSLSRRAEQQQVIGCPIWHV